MLESRQVDFFLLRYVPNPANEGFINIAVLVIADGQISVRLLRDWRRVQALDPAADVEVLKSLADEIKDRLLQSSGWEEMLRIMEDSFSNTVQLSPRKTCLTRDPDREVELLASQYLSTPQ